MTARRMTVRGARIAVFVVNYGTGGAHVLNANCMPNGTAERCEVSLEGCELSANQYVVRVSDVSVDVTLTKCLI